MWGNGQKCSTTDANTVNILWEPSQMPEMLTKSYMLKKRGKSILNKLLS